MIIVLIAILFGALIVALYYYIITKNSLTKCGNSENEACIKFYCPDLDNGVAGTPCVKEGAGKVAYRYDKNNNDKVMCQQYNLTNLIPDTK